MLLLLQSPNNDACIAVGSEVLRLYGRKRRLRSKDELGGLCPRHGTVYTAS